MSMPDLQLAGSFSGGKVALAYPLLAAAMLAAYVALAAYPTPKPPTAPLLAPCPADVAKPKGKIR